MARLLRIISTIFSFFLPRSGHGFSPLSPAAAIAALHAAARGAIPLTLGAVPPTVGLIAPARGTSPLAGAAIQQAVGVIPPTR